MKVCPQKEEHLYLLNDIWTANAIAIAGSLLLWGTVTVIYQMMSRCQASTLQALGDNGSNGSDGTSTDLH